MEDFYIVIPSNVPSLTGEKNKISDFTNYLPSSIDLDRSKWRVALVQIDYPSTWTNISGEVGQLVLKTSQFRLRATIPPKYYSTSTDLLYAINKVLTYYGLETRFSEVEGDVCNVQMGKHEKITLHPTLAGILGFERTDFAYHQSEQDINYFFSDHVIDLRASFYNMYVYSDLVAETLVGNTYVPLLQTVPIRHNDDGELAHHEYLNPQYMPLQTGSISSIHVQLCDEVGNLVEFRKGHVIIKLHFKKYNG